MSRNLRPSLVRIWDGQGFVVGAGFLVGPRHVLTCAHVVAMVLGLSDTASELPRGEVQLDFPLLEESRARIRATTVRWWPVRPDGGGDIAGLLLDSEPPEGAEPALLTSIEEPWGLEFRTFGFPDGRPSGDWASGILADLQATGWLQIEHERQTGRRVQPGYSGAPVWVQSVQGVIGMVVAADQRPADRVAYVIPTHALLEGWPDVLSQRAVPANPYRGLTAFRESDAAVFFGRSDVTDRLDSAVHARSFTALVGPSGSGKSSVARAGLVARLREAGGWTIVDFRPRKEPFDELAATLLPQLNPGLTKLDLLEETPKLARLLREGRTERVLRQIVDETGTRLLLIADQFEELYTHSPDPRSPQQLVHELLRAVDAFSNDPGDGLSVLVVMRADFLNQALGDRDFAEALAGAIEPIGPMAHKQLQEVIEGPAKLRGTRFDPGLIDRIMADVGDQPGRLPLLEFTLTLLWDEQENRRITHAAYNAIEALPMPTIAVVHGAAIGSGSEIAAACDFIIATPEATFSTPEALWGTVGATQRLARVLGKRLAKDLMFTGRKLTADEARTAGLVTRIVEAGALDAALADIAATIGKASATGLRQAKRCIDQGSELDPRGALAVELLAIEENLAQDSQGDTWRTRMAGFKGATSQGST